MTNQKNSNQPNFLSLSLSPSSEYWLNRILRDHGIQIFIVTVLFLLIILVSIAYDAFTHQGSSQLIRTTNINVTSTSNTNSEIKVVRDGKTVIMKNDQIEVYENQQ